MEELYKYIIRNTTDGSIPKEIGIELLKRIKQKANRGGIIREDIAVIGIGLNMPGAKNKQEFWDILESGTDCITDFPDSRRKDTDKYLRYINEEEDIKYTKGAYLDEIDKFDYEFFSYSPREASLMDPAHRLFLQTAVNCIEDAGYGGDTLKGSDTGIYIGYASCIKDNYQIMIKDVDFESLPLSIVATLPAMIPARLAYFLDLKGPSMVIDTACSSSMVAIHTACRALKNRECNMALAGGIKIHTLPVDWEYAKLGIEAQDGRTKAFNHDSDGTGIGEGIVVVMLKRLKKAIDDGDNIYAIIKGSAINQDGKTNGITSPSPSSQTEVILKSWKEAGIDPETITYIQAHGTGTSLGDPIEIKGITDAFRKVSSKKQFCALSSVKTNIGHLYENAGAASFITAVLSLQKKMIPPSINFHTPNRDITFENSPVYVNDKLREWNPGSSRRCGVSSFGYSGTNCHMILQEYQMDEPIEKVFRKYIFSLSAKSEYALKEGLKAYREWLSKNDDYNPEGLSYTLNLCRGHYKYRIAFTAASKEEFKEKIIRLNEYGIKNRYNDIYFGDTSRNSDNPELAAELDNRASTHIKSLEYNYDSEILEEICRCYVEGAYVNWNGLYEDRKINRISLPGYVFDRYKCWVKTPDFCDDNLFHELVWKPANIPDVKKGNVNEALSLVFTSDSDLSGRLIQSLLKSDAKLIIVKFAEKFEKINDLEYSISKDESSYYRLFEHLREVDFTRIIHLCSLDAVRGSQTKDELYDNLNLGVLSMFSIIKAMMEYKKDKPVDFVLISLETDNKDSLVIPENKSIVGFIRAAKLEFPKYRFKCIDVKDDDDLAPLINEIYFDDYWEHVLLRAKDRYVPLLQEVKLENRGFGYIKENGTYIITGGTSGIGLKIAEHLSCHGHVNLALLSRTGIPDRENWRSLLNQGADRQMADKLKTIQRIEGNGSTAAVYNVDITDQSRLADVISDIRKRFGGINGVIHSAGMGNDKYMSEQTIDGFRGIADVKIIGTMLLDRLTQNDNLDFFVLFSSVASIYSARGQCSYAAANSYLDAYTKYRRGMGKTVAVNWVSWKQTGMAVRYGLAEDMVFKSINPEEGVNAFSRILDNDIGNVLVGKPNYKSKLVEYIKLNDIVLSDEIAARISNCNIRLNENVKALEYTDHSTVDMAMIKTDIKSFCCLELGYETMDEDKDFFNLGADSILIARVFNKLSEKYPNCLEIRNIFEYPTIDRLSRHIYTQLTGENAETVTNIYSDMDKSELKDSYPLSSAQLRVYLNYLRNPASTEYNISKVFIITGRFNLSKFQECLNVLISRHDILRTCFIAENGKPVQKIRNSLYYTIEEKNVYKSDLGNNIRSAIIPYDLTKIPLFKIMMFRIINTEESYVLIDMHHIITDGASMDLLVEQLSLLYMGMGYEESYYQYRDYAIWQNHINSNIGCEEYKILQKQREYWLNQLHGASFKLDLPTDYSRDGKKDSQGEQYVFELKGGLYLSLKNIIHNTSSTWHMLLIAAYCILLSEFTGKKDICIGTPVLGRSDKSLANVIGMFVNTLIIRCRPEPEKSYKSLLEEVKAVCRDAFVNQDYQFDNLINDLKVKGDITGGTVIDTMFAMQNVGMKRLSFSEMSMTDYEFDTGTSMFDLYLEAIEKEESIKLCLQYSNALFRKDTIRKLSRNYLDVLLAISNDMNAKLGGHTSVSDGIKALIDSQETIEFKF